MAEELEECPSCGGQGYIVEYLMRESDPGYFITLYCCGDCDKEWEVRVAIVRP